LIETRKEKTILFDNLQVFIQRVAAENIIIITEINLFFVPVYSLYLKWNKYLQFSESEIESFNAVQCSDKEQA